jgi:hypothetical protein
MKKTNKENPLTFFRKANETRQKNVRTSIKKAQDGIEMNDDMINKSGSTGGYKAPAKKWWLEDTNKMLEESAKNVDTVNRERMQANQAMQSKLSSVAPTRVNNVQKAYLNALTNRPKSNTPMMDSLFQHKKGGTVKRKKK